MFSVTITRSFRNVSLRNLAASSSVSARYNSTSTMHENDPEVLEREKYRNLRRSKTDTASDVHEHAPGWNETLASSSEANVKADKSQDDPQSMQSKTVNFMRTKRQETDGETSTTAYYSRDEVSGPLRNADGKDEVIVTHGKVVVDKVGPHVVEKALESEKHMTPSEQRVKADRGEI